jgi:cyclase
MTNREKTDVRQFDRRQALGLMGAAGIGMASALSEHVAGAQAPAPPANPNAPVPPWEPSASAPAIPSWPTEFKQLAPNVYAYIQAGGPGLPSGGISNALAVVGPDHWLAIDALGQPLHTKAFIAAANKASGKPCGRLVNTHHHGDHVAGNQFFLPVEIVSHEYCRDEVVKMAAAVPPGSKFVKREGAADGTEDRKIAIPVTTFNDRMTYRVGNIVVEFIFIDVAHTWGDIVAYLPQEKILVAGDIFFNYVTPYGHNANISKWIEVCEKIDKMDVNVILPGHGPLATKKELVQMADYYRALKPEVRKRYMAGMTPGQAAADIKLPRYQNWRGPEQLVNNVVRLYAEFNGTLISDVLVEANTRAAQEYNAIKAKRV